MMLLVLALFSPLNQKAHADTAYTLWGSGVTPGTVDFGEALSIEVGMKFQPTVDGQITGVQFYKSTDNTGTHIGNLWDDAGNKLASVTFSGETSSGWQEADFSSPVSVDADTTYVISYWAPNGHYAADNWYFTQPYENQPLIALASTGGSPNGVYHYSNDSFPSDSYQASNYWVQPIFTTSNTIPSPSTPPTAPSGSSNLFGSQTPATTSASDSDAVQLGMRFNVDTDGKIYGVRFYKGSGNTGTHIGYLWSETGTLLSQVRFDNETSSGWQEAIFQTPVDVTADTMYVVSYFAPHGHYAVDGNYFTQAVDNGSVHAYYDVGSGSANGTYYYGTSQFIPTSSYNHSNYWVDVIYKADS